MIRNFGCRQKRGRRARAGAEEGYRHRAGIETITQPQDRAGQP
jgi:hypothetical protein